MKTFHKFTLLFLFLSIFNATLSCSSNDKTLPQPIPDIEEEEEETKDVVLPEDIQIIPYGGKASEYQPGSDIDKSYDGKFTQGISFESHYHSSWSNTSFPATISFTNWSLEYVFITSNIFGTNSFILLFYLCNLAALKFYNFLIKYFITYL